MKDDRNWPDPTEPRASKPPFPKGCTCQDGHKLDCPVHGLNGSQKDLDNQWANVHQAPAISYPQDAPRSWQQAYSSIVSLKRTRDSLSHVSISSSHSYPTQSRLDSKIAIWQPLGPVQKLLNNNVKFSSNINKFTNQAQFVIHSVQPLSKVSHVEGDIRLDRLIVSDTKGWNSADEINWIPNPPAYIKRGIKNNDRKVSQDLSGPKDYIQHEVDSSRSFKARQEPSMLKRALDQINFNT